MKFFQSIRWRLQLWHGLILCSVLAGFGFTAHRLQLGNEMRRVDQELQPRLGAILEALRRPPSGGPGGSGDSGAPGGPGGGERQGPPPPELREDREPPPRGIRIGPNRAVLFEGDGSAFYYVVWTRQGDVLGRSETAPEDVPMPEISGGTVPLTQVRMRGALREAYEFTRPGECVLVGRSVALELADMHQHALWLLALGGGVLVLGLVGGWWVSSRSLRPIRDISAAATKIAAGDLSQRVQTRDAVSELGELARVLNDTFGRLQGSFERQARFTADASHELRTPVSVLLTQTQSALARERPAAEYRETLAACQRAAQRMRRLTESLLTLARLDAGYASPANESCELDRVAQDAVEVLRPLARERGVTLEIESIPTCCRGKAEHVGQVVANLVSNAVNYNRAGGSVHVTVRFEAGEAVLTVRDTGQGIATEDLPHIFDRFYRVDKARSSAAGGTGLGLAIARAIVEAHGGVIKVASSLGEGSTFSVRLPSASPKQG